MLLLSSIRKVTGIMKEELKLKLIGFATLLYSVGFMAIASIGYLVEEGWHLLRAPDSPKTAG